MLWHIHGEREREDEFAFVYNIYACAHGRACTHVCRSMRVNVFVKLVLYVGLLFFLCVCVCVFNIIYKCVCAVGEGWGMRAGA